MEREQCCGTCRHNAKGEWDPKEQWQDWSCGNKDSENFGVPTLYSDSCEDWEEKEARAWQN